MDGAKAPTEYEIHRRDAEARRRQIAPGHAVGVTEPMIAELVHAFYAKARTDDLVGPIFEAAIADWDEHLAKLCDFWSSVTLMTGRFKGAPMPAHARLPGLDRGHFARWLELWRATAREVCPPEAAALFIARAEMIARSFQYGLAVIRGELPSKAQAALD